MHDNELAFWGSFKTPTLRNIELTAPYMHNGRLMSLGDVIEFYNREDDELPEEAEEKPDRLNFVPRHTVVNPDVHPAIKGLKLTRSDRRALEFFLLCLTDQRVLHSKPPFDHPSLILVDGYQRTTDDKLIENIQTLKASDSR